MPSRSEPAGRGEPMSWAGVLEDVLSRESQRVVGPELASGLHFLYINGWRMDSRTFTALAFAPGERRPSFVVKIGTGAGVAAVVNERWNLEHMALSSCDDFRSSVPRILHHVDGDGITLLFESAVKGEPLETPRDPAGLARVAEMCTDWLLLFHRETRAHPVVLDPETFGRLFESPFQAYFERFRPGPQERAFLESTIRDAQRLLGTSLPLVYHHGDLCPANLFVDDQALEVIDWETPFEPRLPAHDLIHLLACLGLEGEEEVVDAFRSYERTFFEEGARSRVAREALLRYARELEVPAERLPLLFTLLWVEYACEKADAQEELERQAASRGEAPRDLGVWSLARFADGTCVNVKRLAESQGGFFLR